MCDDRAEISRPVSEQIEKLVEAGQKGRRAKYDSERPPGELERFSFHFFTSFPMRVGGPQEGDKLGRVQRPAGSYTLMSMESALSSPTPAAVPPSTLTDAEIVKRVIDGDRALFEILMRRHNQRVYRAARSVVKDEEEVEDVMQQAYMNAFVHLQQFEERSQFSTWMIRIALNEAFARRRRLLAATTRTATNTDIESIQNAMDTTTTSQPDPERQAYAGELRRLLEEAVDALPDTYRSVFVLRDVEGLTTSETSEGLGLGEEAVKTRLHRARAMIRQRVTERLGGAVAQAFQFQAPRCDRVVAAVLARIGVHA
ncbi:MAG TPA: RNA polymerase sigma factor [Vicinamibacterales bacterium]